MQTKSATPTARVPARRLGALVFVLWLVLGLFLVDDYGPNWDAVMGDLPYGERLVAYIETGDPLFLDNARHDPVPPRPDPTLNLDQQRFASQLVYPLGALSCGITSRIFTTELGWLGALAGFHLAVVLYAALTLALVATFGARRGGVLVGVLAALLLAGQPRWFGHAFNDPKDLPECALYFATSIAAFVAIERGGRWRWMLVGALGGLALAQKANALFLPIQIAATWLALRHLGAAAPRRAKAFALDLCAAVLCVWIACVAVSPDAWSRPIGAIFDRLSITIETGRPADASWFDIDPHALLQWGATAPLALLACAAVGAFSKRVPVALRVFLVLGVVVPVGRMLLPGMQNFDGVRHFLEFAPFLALLGALGAVAIVERSLARLPRAARAALACAVALPGLVMVVAVHPNQVVAFNATVGGLGGAQARGWVDTGDYWGNSYLQAIDWLSKHADHGAYVTAPVAEHIFAASMPIRLRSDLRLAPEFEPPTAGVLYVVALSRRGGFGPFLRRVEASEQKVHALTVQGGRVFDIYRVELDPAHTELMDLFLAERVGRSPLGALRHFVARHPALAAEFFALVAAEPDVPVSVHVRAFADRMPPHLLPALESAADFIQSLGSSPQ